jgi:hypothetical protein
MDEPIKPSTVRTLGSFSSRFGKQPAGGSAANNAAIDTSDKVKLKSSGDLTAEIAGLAAAVHAAGSQEIPTDPNQPLYRVRQGDSLSVIAAATLGDSSRWAEIAALNVDQYPSLKHNPALIREGWTLVLPAYGNAGDVEPAAKAPVVRGPRTRPAPAPALDDDDPLFQAKPAPRPAAKQDDCPPKGKAAPKPKPPASANVANAANDYIKGAQIGSQKTKLTGADTETDTQWAVDGQEASVTKQKTKVTGADTRTDTHWAQPEAAKAKPAAIKPKVPVSLDGIDLTPGAHDHIASQQTHVTGADTVTDSHWSVDGDQQELTAQKTAVVGADTHTDTVWKRDPQTGKAYQEPVQQGIRVPVSLQGLKLDPGQNAEIESQETVVDEIDTGTDTHWNVDGQEAQVAKQKTLVTGAETITRTRWKVTNGDPVPQPVQPPAPPKPVPHLCNEQEAVAWLQAHLDANGRISRETIGTMPEGPGKDALLEHFDALLFGYIDPGQQGWVQLHRGDVDALAKALADGGSIKGFAGQLTRRITTERNVGDLTRDGRVDEADLVAYAARLRGGQPYEPIKPKPQPAPGKPKERMQHDLQVFLDDANNKGADPVLSLIRDHAKYVEVATPEQKATMVWRLVDGNPGEDRRNAALQVLEIAGTRKELRGTLESLGERKKGMDTLLNRLGDNDQGKELAQVLLAHNLYQNPLVWSHMDDDATVSLCEALGFKHPMVGTSDALLALSDEARNHMMKELTGGNVTWTELYMAQWINQHNQIPYHIPDHLTENRNGGRR